MRRILVALTAFSLGACTPAFAPRGPDIRAPHMSAEAFEMSDGMHLPYRVWQPASGQAKAVVLALHGFNDHSRAWTMPAESWLARGIATYAYDQRGFGRTAQPGIWAGTDAMVEDLVSTLDLLAARHAPAPVFVAGESMGGAVAMVALASRRLDAAAGSILVAPAVRGRSALNPFERAGLWLLYNTIPGFAPMVQAPGFVPSDNFEMLREFSADPLVRKRTRVDMLKGLIDLMDESLAAAPNISQPSLILIGARDTIIPDGPMATMLARLPPAPPADRQIVVYPAGFHMLLRDRQRARVHADVADWILARATRR